MIDPGAIQLVSDAARVEEVVGEFVDLKRKGRASWRCAPFHNEDAQLQREPRWASTSASAAARAVMPSASDEARAPELCGGHPLARQALPHRPARRGHPEQRAEQTEREAWPMIQQWALGWSVEQLWDTEEGRRIGLSYFRERGFRDETIRHFGLGYVPEGGSVFATAAQEKGFDLDLLEKAGWIKRREDGTPWDFFHGRVTFPVHGLGGQGDRLRGTHPAQRQEEPQVLQQPREHALPQEPLALRHPLRQEGHRRAGHLLPGEATPT